MKNKNISIRLSESMLEALDSRANLTEKDRTEIIRNAIAEYLDITDNSVEKKLQALEQKQAFTNKIIEQLETEIDRKKKKNDTLEARLDELNKLIGEFLSDFN